MFRRRNLIVMVTSISLSSCQSTSFQSEAGKVVDRIEVICAYRADVGPIVRILKKSLPGLKTVDDVAGAVCDEVKKPVAPGGLKGPPVVARVKVTGAPL
ncbi:hypothetical protein NKJ35_06285 [Mesorhizobium sp. M0136]|uniref:hypothetical protein n=1 Tax=Mesorhizobium sp. M0136 TaxID=2956890 RepID=UPI0033387741